MPYLKIQTNLQVPKEKAGIVLKEASSLVSRELNKPEEFAMIALQDETPMVFAGTDAPVAFLELKSIGLPAHRTKDLSRVLCELIENQLTVPKDRVYVKFIDVNHSMWGWKGDTF